MTRPDKKRGFRPLIINDDTYCWRITRIEGHILLEVQHAAVSGQRLLIDLHARAEMSLLGDLTTLNDRSEPVVIRPKLVRESILYALEHGWTPCVSASTLRIDAHEANLPFAELTKTPFDNVIDDILNQTPPIDDTNVQGFQIDLAHFLSHERYLINIHSQKTDDPRCHLIVTGELSHTCKEPLHAGEFMKKQWLENISYKGFGAYQILYKPQTIDFRFVTINRDASYCVTGKIVIERY